MKRSLYKKLLEWKESDTRKPLILEGARQVGKTWILKEFGKNEFKNHVYINCDNNPQLEQVFSDYSMDRVLRNLEAITNQRIVPNSTLIVFDEIQESSKALTSLKYFCEDAPQYHVAVAGSLLGLMDHYGSGFPVGKVDSLKMYPMSFMEFLRALGQDVLADQIEDCKWEDLNSLQPSLVELLRQYYFTGGMPEVVYSYVQTHNLKKVREIQKRILTDYSLDISKHAPKTEIPKINMVWNSLPSQLAKENRKFIFGAVKKGGRAKDFENAIQWLINAGLVHKVNRVKRIELPLKFYEDIDCYKLFMSDLGLLGAMVEAPADQILVGNGAFSSYKGSFTEQYVAQQYFCSSSLEENLSQRLYYYTNDNSTMEIDFVFQASKVFPVEVKAEENLKSKSLSTVLKDNGSLFGIRFSMSNYRVQERMVNVPLPLVEQYLCGIANM